MEIALDKESKLVSPRIPEFFCKTPYCFYLLVFQYVIITKEMYGYKSTVFWVLDR